MEDNRQGCEIFFLKIGQNDEESSQSGDAIVLTMGNRFSSLREDYKVIVVDGAFKSDAKTIKDHLELIGAGNENGNLQIDLMVSTHPDQDHISGLIELADDYEIEIKELWIHGFKKFVDKRNSDFNSITNSISQAKDLIGIAERKNVPIKEPFTGVEYSPDDISASIEVLGPTEKYYDELFNNKEEGSASSTGVAGVVRKFTSKVTDLVRERIFNNETLEDPEPNATSNSNNSSTILLLKFFKGNTLTNLALLTADVGVEALKQVVPLLKGRGWYNNVLERRFIQIPHHGSRRNVGPTVLDALLGETEYGCNRGSAFVSAHEKDKDHPRIQVMNAFTRRGFKDTANVYISKRHSIGEVPAISGWNPVDAIDLLEGEEEDN